MTISKQDVGRLNEGRTHLPLSPESRGGSATKFSGVTPDIDACLPNDVLDLVDPWLEFPTTEHRH